MVLRLAWRNIWRNPTRTVLTLSAIAFTTAILSFFLSLQFSSYRTSIDASVTLLTGHLQVQEPRYKDNPSFRYALEEARELLRLSTELKEVEAASLRAETTVIVSAEGRTFGARIDGVVAEDEEKLSRLPSLIRAGSYSLEPGSYTAIVGKALARNLKVSTGDEITVLGQGYDGSTAAAIFIITGIIESGVQELDRSLVQIPLSTFRELFYFGERAHRLVILARNGDEKSLQSKLVSHLTRRNFTSVAVWRWDELLPGLKESMDLDLASSWIFYMGLIIVVSLTVMNTFLMAVLERKKEFGLLQALGLTPVRLMGLVVIESILLVGIGLFLGSFIAAGVIYYFGIVGFEIPGVEEIVKAWNIPGTVYTELTLQSLLVAPAVMIFTLILTLLVPFSIILSWKPIEAMEAE